jgi:2-polyprenyl-3-methyl-5-hydroxy-6-metoxy-1,4-benzoquinol methylase
MNCCQCQGIEELFNENYVTRELSQYRAKGPDKTTRMLVDALLETDIQGLTLLDIGGGVGAIQHELLKAGVLSAMSVEASPAYSAAARTEAQRMELADRISQRLGDFVDLAEEIAPADIVTLDRVICCYDDMARLVSLSAARARRRYGLVYPRDVWWVKIGLALGNFFLKLRRSHYRAFAHPAHAVEALLNKNGFRRTSYHHTLIWQVVVYTR